MGAARGDSWARLRRRRGADIRSDGAPRYPYAPSLGPLLGAQEESEPQPVQHSLLHAPPEQLRRGATGQLRETSSNESPPPEPRSDDPLRRAACGRRGGGSGGLRPTRAGVALGRGGLRSCRPTRVKPVATNGWGWSIPSRRANCLKRSADVAGGERRSPASCARHFRTVAQHCLRCARTAWFATGGPKWTCVSPAPSLRPAMSSFLGHCTRTVKRGSRPAWSAIAPPYIGRSKLALGRCVGLPAPATSHLGVSVGPTLGAPGSEEGVGKMVPKSRGWGRELAGIGLPELGFG